MGTRGESGVLRGEGEKPNIKRIVKKIGDKIWKSGEIGKKSEKSDIFFLLKMV